MTDATSMTTAAKSMTANGSGGGAPVGDFVDYVDYLAGGWVGIVGPGTLLLVETDPGGRFVRQCWQSVRAGMSANELLTTIHDLPAGEVGDFVLVAVDEVSTRAAARGNCSIRLQQNENGPVTLILGEVSSAGPARTVDRLYDWPAVTFRLAAGYESAWPPQEDQAVLPVAVGTVLASAISGRIRSGLDEADAVDSLRGQGESARGQAERESGSEQDRGTFAVPASEVETGAAEEVAAEGFEVRDFDFEFTPAQSTAGQADDVLYMATPLFADEDEDSNSAAGGADTARAEQVGAAGSAGGETAELEFGFASVPVAPEPEQEDELFASGATFAVQPPAGERPTNAYASEEIVAELTGTSTGFTPIAGREREEEDPDFAPTMIVPVRANPLPPVPERALENESGAGVVADADGPDFASATRGDQQQPGPNADADADDPNFAPTTRDDEKQAGPGAPPIPLAVNNSGADTDADDPNFAPTALVPLRPTAPVSGNDSGTDLDADADDPDFAPTALVPTRPAMPPTPAPFDDQRQANNSGANADTDDPDFASATRGDQQQAGPGAPLIPIAGNNSGASANLDSPDAAPTMIVPIPVPGNNSSTDIDPDFAPTALVPTRPAMPPTPAPLDNQQQPNPDAAPTMIVPIPVPSNNSNPGIDPDDPDFAPTTLVPSNPTTLPPTPAPANNLGLEDLDFAPTMLVPKSPAQVQNPVHVQPPSPDLAPPMGPRFDVGAASESLPGPSATPAPTPAPVPESGGEGQESDADMIWKLDWWDSNHSDSDDVADPAPAQPSFQAPATPQPIPQSTQQPHLAPPIQPQPAQQPTAPPYFPPTQGQPQVVPQPPHLSTPAPPPPPAYQPPAPPFDVEDDTSMTIPRPSNHSAPEADPSGRPLVPAVRCPAGHLNPPQATHCRVCAIPVPPQASYQIPQPVLGVLRLSTGGDVPLDRDVFLGRDPSHTEERKARKPHMLRLPSPGKDISRDHLEIRLVGWRVMVIDLGSTNGTTVIVPGGRPEPLAAGGSRMIEPGTQVVLAEEVSLVYEVTR